MTLNSENIQLFLDNPKLHHQLTVLVRRFVYDLNLPESAVDDVRQQVLAKLLALSNERMRQISRNEARRFRKRAKSDLDLLLKSEHGVSELDDQAIQDPNWLKRIFRRVSEIVLHEDEETENRARLSNEESIALFQKFISERVYNHLAMLLRSPHAKKGGAFSIHEELTEGIAEKIGLGLYLNPKTVDTLHTACEAVLYDLADEFQQWFIGKQNGIYPTIWGEIYATNKDASQEGHNAPALILTPDVTKGQAISATT